MCPIPVPSLLRSPNVTTSGGDDQEPDQNDARRARRTRRPARRSSAGSGRPPGAGSGARRTPRSASGTRAMTRGIIAPPGRAGHDLSGPFPRCVGVHQVRARLGEDGLPVLRQHEPGRDRRVRRGARTPPGRPRGRRTAPGSGSGSIGSVEPNSWHRYDASGSVSPRSTSTGASTAGVRTPPRVLPASSRTKSSPSTSSRAADGAGSPPRAQPSSQRSAARTT